MSGRTLRKKAMKIKDGFMLTEFADSFVAVPQGKTDASSNVIITLNKTSAFIWKCLETDKTFDEVLDELTSTFDVDRQKAKTDLEKVIEIFRQKNLLQ